MKMEDLLYQAEMIKTMKKILIKDLENSNKDIFEIRNYDANILSMENNWHKYVNKEIEKKQKIFNQKSIDSNKKK